MTAERITVVADGRRVEVVSAEAYDELQARLDAVKKFGSDLLSSLGMALVLLAAEPAPATDGGWTEAPAPQESWDPRTAASAEKQERPS
jgi:hypothetical protein